MNNKTVQETDIYSLALEEIKALGVFSFSLEEKRSQILISEAAQMLTAFSYFSAAILLSLPILLQYTTISRKALIIWAGIAFIPLIASLCFSIIAQWRYSYWGLKDIAAIKQHVYANINAFDQKSKYNDFWTLQLAPVHYSIMKNNERRSLFVRLSMLCFLLSITILIAAVIYFIV